MTVSVRLASVFLIQIPPWPLPPNWVIDLFEAYKLAFLSWKAGAPILGLFVFHEFSLAWVHVTASLSFSACSMHPHLTTDCRPNIL